METVRDYDFSFEMESERLINIFSNAHYEDNRIQILKKQYYRNAIPISINKVRQLGSFAVDLVTPNLVKYKSFTTTADRTVIEMEHVEVLVTDIFNK